MLSKESSIARGLPKKTESLCPECLAIIEATMREENGRVVMEKSCEKHVGKIMSETTIHSLLEFCIEET